MFGQVVHDAAARRVVRRESVMLRSTVDPIHLAGRFDINIHPLAVLTAVSYRIGDDAAVMGDLFGQVPPDGAVGVS